MQRRVLSLFRCPGPADGAVLGADGVVAESRLQLTGRFALGSRYAVQLRGVSAGPCFPKSGAA